MAEMNRMAIEMGVKWLVPNDLQKKRKQARLVKEEEEETAGRRSVLPCFKYMQLIVAPSEPMVATSTCYSVNHRTAPIHPE